MLNLRVVSTQNSETFKQISMDRGILLIGRDPPAEEGGQVLALPDPERMISRLHARIEYRNGNYHLIDTSTNGVLINDAVSPLGKGNAVALHEGDCLTIGNYRFYISLSDEQTLNTDPPTRIGTLETIDEPNGEENGDKAMGTADFPDDLFAGLEAFSESASPAPPGEPFDDSPLAEPFPVPPSTPATTRPEAPPPPSRTEMPQTAPSDTPVQSERNAIDAFLEGAGLQGELSAQTLPQDVARTAGSLFRTMVQNMMDLLRSRAQIKNELRLDMTMLGAVENNPLKFSVTTHEAMRHLLQPEPGYLAGEEAAREAAEDLMAHQIAMVSGMQAALKAALKHFDPKLIAQRAEKRYPLAYRLPWLRRAKCWSVLDQTYEDMVKEVEGDFMALFGRLFAEAYEAQIQRVRQERRR